MLGIPSSSSWSTAPERLRLGSNEVHIWRAALNQPSSRAESFLDILTADEQQRAERFHFRKDRDHFVIARGILRMILSRYLHIEPEALRFCYSRYGKPALMEASGIDALRFNVSHANELALYGVTLNRQIGLDIEYMREGFASEQIAERFFSPIEVAMLRELPAHMQTEGFFNCWTRKEAYIKARGEGLSLPLDGFDVSLAPGEPARLLSVRDNTQEALRWSLRELTPGPGYVAAVAVEGHDWQQSCWLWAE
jgi:4'-phosphopantetheinyl transferase